MVGLGWLRGEELDGHDDCWHGQLPFLGLVGGRHLALRGEPGARAPSSMAGSHTVRMVARSHDDYPLSSQLSNVLGTVDDDAHRKDEDDDGWELPDWEAPDAAHNFEIVLFPTQKDSSEGLTASIRAALADLCVVEAGSAGGIRIFADHIVGDPAALAIRIFQRLTARKPGATLPPEMTLSELFALLDLSTSYSGDSTTREQVDTPQGLTGLLGLTVTSNSDISKSEMTDPPPLLSEQPRGGLPLSELFETARQAVDENGDVGSLDWQSQLVEGQTEAESERLSVLGEIALRSEQAAKVRQRLIDLVDKARTMEISWSQIGKASGISLQAAHRRWDPEARRKHNVYQQRRKRRDPSEDSDS